MDLSDKVVRKRFTKDGLRVGSKKHKKMKELKRLEKIVFGDPSAVTGEKRRTTKKRLNPGVETTTKGFEEDSNYSDESKKKPAWDDEDDEESIHAALQVQGRLGIQYAGKPTDVYTGMLKSKFKSIVGTPKWAQMDREEKNSDDEDMDKNGQDIGLLQRCGNFIEKRNTLEKGKIQFKRVKNLNNTTMCEGPVITSVEFHPTSSISLVAGLSGVASVFEVDGKVNAKLQCVQFTKFEIHCAKFSHDGDQFIVGSMHHKDFHCYDLIAGKPTKVRVDRATDMTNMKKFEVSPDGRFIAVCGRFGNIFLLSGKTKEWIDTLRMNTDVKSISFSSDGLRLYSHGDEGNVYIWDLNSRMCIHRFYDDGSLKGTSIAVSPDNKMIACGSSSGVVNVYDAGTALTTAAPQPLKIFKNLTTAVSSLEFNHTSELLAMASDKNERSFKLAHFPSLTVYSNFPESTAICGWIKCLSFSPLSGYIAAGSNIKKAFLYRLNHFGSY